MDDVIVPLYPASHRQPVGTEAPALWLGQETGVHVFWKKGDTDVAVTDPL